MRTFAQKPKATQKTTSAKTALPARARFGLSRDVKSILHLQRTIGNQAVQRLSERTKEDIKEDSATTDFTRLGHDVSRIPIHASVPRTVQTTQTGSGMRDGHAQEARSRIAGKLGAPLPEERLSVEISGNDGPGTKSTPTAPPPTAAALPTPTPTAPGPTTPTGPTITITGGTKRGSTSQVGVGQVVDFKGSAAGTWKASIGTAVGPNSTTFSWTAPATTAPGTTKPSPPLTETATITLTVGTQSATKTMTVVPPNSISMRNARSHGAPVGAGGACMLTQVTYGPKDVCLGAIQWLEVPGPATGVKGYFEQASDLYHKPSPDYHPVDNSNRKHGHDHCFLGDRSATGHSAPGPYSDGEFTWKIPNRYILDGESASDGRFFTYTYQVFTMNAAGKATITKADAETK